DQQVAARHALNRHDAGRDLLIWVAMLLVQSLPYLAALVMALLSSLPKPREELAGGAERIGG
ncbi:hypothetical protein ACV341_23860, partial [Pseudomonas aeruginosa]